MTALWTIIGLWRGRAGWLAAGAVVTVLGVVVGLAMMGYAAAAVLGAAAGASLLRVLGPGRVILRYGERMLTHDAMFRALADLRVWFFRGVATRSAGGLGFRRAGDVLARLVGDVEALDGLYMRIFLPLAGAVVLLPGLAWLVGGISPGLAAAVVLLFAAAAFLLPAVAARGTLAAGRQLAQAGAALRVAVLDTLTGLREVHVFGATGRMLAEVQGRESTLLAAQHTEAMRVAWAGAGAFLCAQAAILLVLFAAGARPEYAFVLFVVIAGFEAIAGLPRAGAAAGQAAAAAARVLEAAEGPGPLPDPPAPAKLPPGSALRFEAVGFRWQPDRPPVFEDLTLDVPARARVALIGPSGAGKSTLAALALKVVAPQSGRVLLGGADLATLRAADVRGRIAWLAQATHLFDDSVRNNLLLGRPDADDAALWDALEAAQVADVVRALPDGLDAWVGEGAAKISGGQGRRLALARALLSPAPILMLDEPCAGLDAETERAFFTTLNATAADRTVILIAHRLTGVERLDRIYRLSAGHAVAAAGV
jgi:ATP-binding cassette subfamily C protein CydC